MPAKNGLRLDDDDRLAPGMEQARAYEKLQPIDEAEPRAHGPTTKDVHLVAKHGVLDDEFASRSARITHDGGDFAGGAVWCQA